MKSKLTIWVLIAISSLMLFHCSNGRNENKSLHATESDSVNIKLVQGGIVIYKAGGHGLIAATSDLGKFEWPNARTACEDLVSNGYDDWRLPTREELDAMYKNLKSQGVGKFESGSYWCSSEYNNYYAWRQNFNTGRTDRRGNKTKKNNVRAVRSF